MYNFEINSQYSFNTVAPTVLGAQMKNITILGIIDYSIATTFINVDLMHRSIYPLLPQGTIDNPKKYTYLLILTESGQKTVVAYEWIDENTILKVTVTTLTVTIPNVSVGEINKIRDALELVGFTITAASGP